MAFDDAFENRLQDQRIAADIPPRLQAEPCMRLADGRDRIHVLRVELGRSDQLPMPCLPRLGALDMGVAGKEARGFGIGLGL
ncbi:hypothetical protein D3C80_1952500 [compost metagenome]